MYFHITYNSFIHFRYILLIAFIAETAIAGTIPAEKGYLYKADWRFIRELVAQMKWRENWPQKQQALRVYATSYEESKKYDNYESALEKGIRLYTDYDALAKLLSHDDEKLYKQLLANQNAFDNLINLAISKHKTIENSFKRVKNALAMEWVIIFALFAIAGINYLRKYNYLNDLHVYLIDHYIKFFSTICFIIFAYLIYLFAGPATLGSPRRVSTGLQKTLAKEATHRYSESIYFYTIYYLPTYQTNQQYELKLNKTKTVFNNLTNENNDNDEDMVVKIAYEQNELVDLDTEFMAFNRIHEAHHEIKTLYEKQNLENYYAVHPERKPQERKPVSTTPPKNVVSNKKPPQPIKPINTYPRQPNTRRPSNQIPQTPNQNRQGNIYTRPSSNLDQFNKKIINSILKDLPSQGSDNTDVND